MSCKILDMNRGTNLNGLNQDPKRKYIPVNIVVILQFRNLF
ncbi:UNVERIFIED_CONTAM: hypothetical protein NCL1_47474 [Trichonephila clavipes]